MLTIEELSGKYDTAVKERDALMEIVKINQSNINKMRMQMDILVAAGVVSVDQLQAAIDFVDTICQTRNLE